MVTIEMIDRVMDATGKDYATIKAELQNNGGDVEKAIEALGGTKGAKTTAFNYQGKEIKITPQDFMDAIKDIWETGSASSLIIEKDGKQVFKFNLLLTGALSIVLIWPVLLGLGAAIVADYNIKIQLADGKVIDINDEVIKKKFEEVKDVATEMASDFTEGRKHDAPEATVTDTQSSPSYEKQEYVEREDIKTENPPMEDVPKVDAAEKTADIDEDKVVEAEYTEDEK